MENVSSSSKGLRIAVSAGEVSGDQRAAEVVRVLKDIAGKAEFKAMGGTELESADAELVVDARELGGVMGITEVFAHLPKLISCFGKMSEMLERWRPHCLLLVDYPDFNLRLAAKARKLDIPVYYYIPPKVWAWRSGRVKLLDERTDELGVLFPFEPDFYAERGCNKAHYVGHPFVRTLAAPRVPREELFAKIGLDTDKPVLLLLAGSRPAELKRHVPEVYQVAISEVVQKAGFQSVWVLPSEKHVTLLREILSEVAPDYTPVTHVGDSVDLMHHADLGVLKSGTCNLEAAFCGLPFVCFYKASPVSAWVARTFLKIGEVSLVNIVRPHTVEEFLQERCTGKLLVEYVERLWSGKDELENLKGGLREVRAAFGQAGEHTAAEHKVARSILSLAGIKPSDGCSGNGGAQE